MKKHLANSLYGVLDYVSYPAALLLASPLLIREIGVERYGIWMLASAMTMTGGVVASGLGDANLRAIAESRGAKNRSGAFRTVENALGIHMVLGAAVALAGWTLCPRIAVRSAGKLYAECLWSLRLACVLILIRAIETVWVSTFRGASLYGRAFSVSGICRLASLLAATILPLWSKSVIVIMAAWVLICACGLLVQSWQAKCLFGLRTVRPRLEWNVLFPLLTFGSFTWIQAVVGLVFTQVDRLVVGMLFGASEVTSYAICAQLAQPLYGISAAGLHFLFPYLASLDHDEGAVSGVGLAFAANAVFVASGIALLKVCGPAILTMIGGRSMAVDTERLLPLLAYSAALAALSVPGFYAVLALGRAKQVAFFSISGGVLGMFAALPFAHVIGPAGLAYARMLYGVVVLMIYIPLCLHFWRKSRLARRARTSWEDA